MFDSAFRGMWLGFCIAAPVGPIGILVMKQALRSGRWAGIVSGLGAALADLIYGCLAIGGVRLAAGFDRALAIVGGVLLLCLAVKSWRERPATHAPDAEAKGAWRNLGTTFVLTLSNPITILAFAAMIAATGAAAPAQFVAGVFLGSMLWWIILSTSAAWIGALLAVRGDILNRVAAVTLACFGVWAIWSRS